MRSKFLFFHRNHVVKCPDCKSFLVRKSSSRYTLDGYHAIYKCLLCHKQFTCCAKHHTYDKIANTVKLIRHHKKQIKRLEAELHDKSY